MLDYCRHCDAQRVVMRRQQSLCITADSSRLCHGLALCPQLRCVCAFRCNGEWRHRHPNRCVAADAASACPGHRGGEGHSHVVRCGLFRHNHRLACQCLLQTFVLKRHVRSLHADDVVYEWGMEVENKGLRIQRLYNIAGCARHILVQIS